MAKTYVDSPHMYSVVCRINAEDGVQWYQANPHQFHVVALGTLHALPTPVPRRSQKPFKPAFFETLRQQHEAEDGVRDVQLWLQRVRTHIPPVPPVLLIPVLICVSVKSLGVYPSRRGVHETWPWALALYGGPAREEVRIPLSRRAVTERAPTNDTFQECTRSPYPPPTATFPISSSRCRPTDLPRSRRRARRRPTCPRPSAKTGHWPKRALRGAICPTTTSRSGSSMQRERLQASRSTPLS